MQRLDYKELIETKQYFIPHVIRFFTTTTLYNTTIDEKYYNSIINQFFLYLNDLSVHPLSYDTLDIELLPMTKTILLSKSPPYQILDILYETIALYDLVLFSHKYRIKGYRLFLILERSLVNSQLKDFFSSDISIKENLRSKDFLREHHTRYYSFFSKLVNQLCESRLSDYYSSPETRRLEEKFEKVYTELFQKLIHSIDLKIPQKIQNNDYLIRNYVNLKTRRLRNSIIFYSEIKHELIEYSLLLHNSGEKFSITPDNIYEIVVLLDQQLANNYTQHLESPWKIAINIIKILDIHAFLYLFYKIPMFRLIDLVDINIRSNQHKEKIIGQILELTTFKKVIDTNKDFSTEEINKLKKIYSKKVEVENKTQTERKKINNGEKLKQSLTENEISIVKKKLSTGETKKKITQDSISQSKKAITTHVIDASKEHESIIFTPFQLLPSSKYNELIKQLESLDPVFTKISQIHDYFLLTQNDELLLYAYNKELLQIIQSLLHLVTISSKIANFENGFILIVSKAGFIRWRELFGVPPALKKQKETLD